MVGNKHVIGAGVSFAVALGHDFVIGQLQIIGGVKRVIDDDGETYRSDGVGDGGVARRPAVVSGGD